MLRLSLALSSSSNPFSVSGNGIEDSVSHWLWDNSYLMCIHSKCFFICVIQHKFKEKALQNNDTLHIKDVSEGSTYYLFKWSKRKRNVTRLGSGSDNNRFNIQLSFATGSESATRQKIITHHHRQRMKIISQTTNTDALEWTVITSQAGRTEFHINSPQDLFENTFLSSSSSAFKIPAVMMYCPYKVSQGIAPSPLKRLPCRAAQGREHAQPRTLSLCLEPILPKLGHWYLAASRAVQAHGRRVSCQCPFLSSISLP